MSASAIRQAVKRAVVVTLGEEGAVIWAGEDREEEIRIPSATPARIADPTGVGDAFRAGFIKGLALGLPWAACGRLGSVAAVYVLETKGPQAHQFTLQTFLTRYQAAFGEDEATEALTAFVV